MRYDWEKNKNHTQTLCCVDHLEDLLKINIDEYPVAELPNITKIKQANV